MQLVDGDNWIRERRTYHWRGRKFVRGYWRLVRVAISQPGTLWFSAVQDPYSWDTLTPQSSADGMK